MAKRYAIWDKVSPVITPSGEVFTAEQWMDRYPVARLENIKILCSVGEINGGIFGTFGDLVRRYEDLCDFSNCETDEDYLEVIEAYEDSMNMPSNEPTTEERIAAALEAQVLLSLPDEEEVE